MIAQRQAFSCLTTTLNNMSIVYKSLGKYKTAIQYSKEQLDLDKAALKVAKDYGDIMEID